MNPLITNGLNALSGYKMYLALAAGAIVIALNHFMVLYGYWPIDMLGLDPNNWAADEYKLLLGATGRSAISAIVAKLNDVHQAVQTTNALIPPVTVMVPPGLPRSK